MSKIPTKLDLKAIKDKFIFVCVGGCDCIGTNFYLYQYNGHWIGIDFGLGFADKLKTPGVEIMLPSLDFIRANKIKLDGLIITHAHEDHIGGVVQMYSQLNCPIYATTFGINFLKVDALEMPVVPNLKFIEIKDGKRKFKIGDFELESINLTHSTIEAQGIYIKTPKGSVFHTGDWRFDNTPPLGKPSDKKRLAEIVAKEPLSLLVCDSTNCQKNKQANSEADLVESLTKIVEKRKNMVVVSTFASNIYRIHTMYQVAQNTKRRLVLSGHSMGKIVEIARQSGYLDDIDFLDAKDARKFPRNKLLVLSTGCQGEKNASMYKLAHGCHRFLQLKAGDCVIFSSKVIPGNELDVQEIMNQLILKQVEIVTEKDHLIHCSGHPYRPDLKEMYELTKPACFMPMHGDWLMLTEHAKFANKCGLKNIIIPQNGTIVEINKTSIEELGQFNSPALCLDGNRLLDENSKIFTDRRAISNEGFVSCYVVIDKKGKFLATPEIRSIGLFDFKNGNHIEIMKSIAHNAMASIKPKMFGHRTVSKEDLEIKIKDSLTMEIHKQIGKLPVIDVVVSII